VTPLQVATWSQIRTQRAHFDQSHSTDTKSAVVAAIMGEQGTTKSVCASASCTTCVYACAPKCRRGAAAVDASKASSPPCLLLPLASPRSSAPPRRRGVCGVCGVRGVSAGCVCVCVARDQSTARSARGRRVGSPRKGGQRHAYQLGWSSLAASSRVVSLSSGVTLAAGALAAFGAVRPNLVEALAARPRRRRPILTSAEGV